MASLSDYRVARDALSRIQQHTRGATRMLRSGSGKAFTAAEQLSRNACLKAGRVRQLSTNTLVIIALSLLCLYVLLGFGPFGASSYNRDGTPEIVDEFGSSTEHPFVTF